MDKQREILQALGWRQDRYIDGAWHCPRCGSGTVGDCPALADKAIHRGYHRGSELPNLSDPGVLLPLFEQWCSMVPELMSVTHKRTLRIAVEHDITLAFYERILKDNVESVGAGGRTTAEAIISAWHAALVAMGKIEARDVR